jgi:predicted permease
MRKMFLSMFRRTRSERELDEELRSYFESLVDEKIAAGLTTEEALRAAKIELGGMEQVKEQVRDIRPGAWLDGFLQDLRYALRGLLSHPGFSAVIVISLALGIGANSALFSVFNAVLLRTLPVPHPEQLFALGVADSSFRRPDGFSYPLFQRMRSVTPTGLAAMTRVARMHGAIDGDKEAEEQFVQLVSGDYFAVLGLSPALGRMLGPDDHRADAQQVAVISYGLWERQFGGSPGVLGRGLTLNGAHVTIVGVAPSGFTGIWLESPAEVWIPLTMQPVVHYAQNFSSSGGSDSAKPWLAQEEIRWLNLVVRTRANAGALDTVFRQSIARQSEANSNPDARRLLLQLRLSLKPIARGFSNLRQQYTAPLFALMAMVVLVLLIACANTANLLLARSNRRKREMALRLALGASRGRLIRQLMTENFLLAAIAAAAGLAIANGASELLVRQVIGVSQAAIPTGVDGRVFGFTVLLSVVTTFLFGMAPAFHATRVELESTLKTAARGVHLGARLNAQKLLVATQMALTLVLTVGALWFAESLRNLASLNLGFDQEHVVTVWINPQSVGYRIDRMPELYRRLLDGVRGLPGVVSASVAMCGLEGGCRSTSDIQISGYQSREHEQIIVQENHVGLNYFSTVGMRLTGGRDFTDQDSPKAPRVAIVNEAFARRYFPQSNPIGRRFGYTTQADTEIVGMVEDARVNSVREEPPVMAFYSLQQAQEIVFAGSLEVRVMGDPGARVAEIRKVATEVDRNLPIDRVTTLSEQVHGNLRQDRLIMWLASTFGLLAVGLASFGMYGAMSYAVTRRTAELGLRLALGAPQGRVFLTIFGESLGLAAVGLAVGLPFVLAASRAVSGILVGVKANDPLLVCAAALGLAAIAALAAYLPAWRASRVDPVIALRYE